MYQKCQRMPQYKDHGKSKWVVFFCADFPGQLIKHIFLSPNQLLAQLVLGEISIYLRRPAVGPDSISSTLLVSDQNQVPSPQRPSCGRVVYSERAAEISEAVNFENLANSVNFQVPPASRDGSHQIYEDITFTQASSMSPKCFHTF